MKLNGCRQRANSVMMVETIVSVTPEYIGSLPAGEQKELFQSVTDFMKQRVGKQNILSAIVHMDETSPHMHLCFCPITKDGRLCAKDILATQRIWQGGRMIYSSTCISGGRSWSAVNQPMRQAGSISRHGYSRRRRSWIRRLNALSRHSRISTPLTPGRRRTRRWRSSRSGYRRPGGSPHSLASVDWLHPRAKAREQGC